MTLRPLHELQDVMFRIYVRNVMFLATLPYHFAGGADARRTRGDFIHADRSRCANRVHDTRWLR
jgi:hypothetical protein